MTVKQLLWTWLIAQPVLGLLVGRWLRGAGADPLDGWRTCWRWRGELWVENDGPVQGLMGKN